MAFNLLESIQYYSYKDQQGGSSIKLGKFRLNTRLDSDCRQNSDYRQKY